MERGNGRNTGEGYFHAEMENQQGLDFDFKSRMHSDNRSEEPS